MSNAPQTLLHDQYNSVLLSNVRPPDWVNPQPASRYNLVILGAGPAGLTAAKIAADAGAKVALVEERLLGGEGLNNGCVPSKSLVRAGRAHADAYLAGQYGVRMPETIEGDFATTMMQLRRTRSVLSSRISARRLREMGIDIFLGKGRFFTRDAVEVAGKVLRFSKALVATGSTSIVPAIEGLSRVGYLTSETVFSLTHLPRRLAVIGAGPVGCELAQAFCRLGSEVVLIERESQILPGEDPDACRILAYALQYDDLVIKLGAIVTHVRANDAEKTLHLRIDGHGESLAVDEILVCAGRAANTDGMDLPMAGIRHDTLHGVLVDDFLRTSNPKIYAAGDVCTQERFAHVADAMARIAVHNALFFGRKRFSRLVIPHCIYTDPEVARVGIGCDEAHRRGWRVDSCSVSFRTVDRAVIDGNEDGLLKIHVLKDKDTIIGATIIGRQAGDMIDQIALAMAHKIGLAGIAQVVYPYPTYIEALRTAAEACSKKRSATWLNPLVRRWLAWSR